MMSMFGDWFSEDEDDIFMGSPKSKFFDVSREASKEVVEDEIDKIPRKNSKVMINPIPIDI